MSFILWPRVLLGWRDFVVERLLECLFLIPLTGDPELSLGERHSDQVWEWLARELMTRYEEPAEIDGSPVQPPPYENWDVARPPHSEFRRFTIAVKGAEIDDLRRLVADCCDVFDLKSVELSVAGAVETVRRHD